MGCLLYTSDAADDITRVDIDDSRIKEKKKTHKENENRKKQTKNDKQT